MSLPPLPKGTKIGLGTVCYKRPEYLKQTAASVKEHLTGVIDSWWIYNDGSPKGSYDEVYKTLGIHTGVHHAKENKGVAAAKNWLLETLLKEGCDWIFIQEEDILVTDPQAITGYIKAAKASGLHHLMFAHHGPANVGFKPVLGKEGKTAFYYSYVGAWSLYTRRSLKDVGLMDENFHNAWEHVEHTFRLAKGRYTTWPLAADAKNSAKWLKEIPGSIETSFMRNDAKWAENLIRGLLYWKDKDPQFPLQANLDYLMSQLEIPDKEPLL